MKESKKKVSKQIFDLPSGCFTSETVDDLHRIASALDGIEIRLSILSVQMQYAESPFFERTASLTRDIGELNDLLKKVLAFSG